MTQASSPDKSSAPWFVDGDWDGFFALFFSGFPDLLLIVGLAPLCGFPLTLVTTRILPGVALSILAGNIFYAWQAHRLTQRSGRSDVTAIPFGVNAPTIFAYIFLIMLPVYQRTHDSNLAWQAGVFACFLSGIVQTAGAFCTDWLRRNTPRAALLCPLAGIAMAFLCLGFVLRVFQTPELALLPAIIILTIYSARIRLPFRLPGGLVCIVSGAILAALLKAAHLYHLPEAQALVTPGIHLPHPIHLFEFLRQGEGWKFLSVILPMSALDTIVSLQVLESVQVAGDDYPTMPSLLVNGLATVAAAAFGSPFPTALYFGHMAHKALGARAGYSILSGAATMLICLTGLVSPFLRYVPLEVVAMIVVWFGLVMVAQAFTEIPKAHAIAVAFGLIPMLASWAVGLIDVSLRKAGSSFLQSAPLFGEELSIYGLIALSQGALLVSMIWAAAIAMMLDRKFLRAASWLGAAAVLSCFGLVHAFRITNQGIENAIGIFAAPKFALSYLAGAVFLVGFHIYATRTGTVTENSSTSAAPEPPNERTLLPRPISQDS
jgi:AGZA family xanthine/uracil permease-like MFS transporter